MYYQGHLTPKKSADIKSLTYDGNVVLCLVDRAQTCIVGDLDHQVQILFVEALSKILGF